MSSNGVSGNGGSRTGVSSTGVGSTDERWRRPRTRSRARRSRRRVALRAASRVALLGPVAGLLWWLLTPGGWRSAGPSYLDLVQSSGAAVGSFALVCLVAGAVAGIGWVVVREDAHDARAVARLVGVLLGGFVGAALAWGVGALLQVLLPAPLPDLPAEVTAGLVGLRPGLGVVAAALLWPLTSGVLVAVDTLRDVVWQTLVRDDATTG